MPPCRPYAQVLSKICIRLGMTSVPKGVMKPRLCRLLAKDSDDNGLICVFFQTML